MLTTQDERPHSWNYRVRVSMHPSLSEDSDEEEVYEIIEAYYAQGSNNIIMWAEPKDVQPCGESVEELRDDLQAMLRATERPVVLAEELPHV